MRIKYTVPLIIVLSFVCHAQQTIDTTLAHDRELRETLMYIPASYSDDTPSPLLFNFHGLDQSRDDLMMIADFRSIADTTGIILVYPQALPRMRGMRDGNYRWNSEVPEGYPDDLGFTAAMIDTISSTYNIDLNRVYATGYSNGGYFCQALACFLSESIAAIAPVKASMRDAAPFIPGPQHPTPVLLINNTLDDRVLYEGTDNNMAIQEVICYWVDYNNCDPDPDTLRLDDFDEDDGIRVDHFIYSGGDNQVNVELILEIAKRRIDNGHFYPTSSPESPWYFDSPTEVWRFVSRYDINGLLEIKNSDEFMKLDFRLLQNYPNPFNSTTTIKYYLQVPSDVNLSIYNTKGQLVHTLSDGWHSAGGYKKILNGTSLPTGKYFLCLEAGNQNRIVRIILLQ